MGGFNKGGSAGGGGGVTNAGSENYIPKTDADGNLVDSSIQDNGVVVQIAPSEGGASGVYAGEEFSRLGDINGNGNGSGVFVDDVSQTIDLNAANGVNFLGILGNLGQYGLRVQSVGKAVAIGDPTGAVTGTCIEVSTEDQGEGQGLIRIFQIPTSDPGVASQLWNDGGTLRISTIETHSTNYALTAADNGKAFTSDSSSTLTFTLPAMSTLAGGERFTFRQTVQGGINIVKHAGDPDNIAWSPASPTAGAIGTGPAGMGIGAELTLVYVLGAAGGSGAFLSASGTIMAWDV